MEESIKRRVYNIYILYQDAVDFNSVLNAIYQNHFGKVESTSTIERAGRFWRNTMPHLFNRSKNKCFQDHKQTQKILEVFVK
jgi:hypothetical protein